MHAAIHSFNNPRLAKISSQLLHDILFFIQECYTTLNEMHNVLSYNKIWKQRLVNIGTYQYKAAVQWGLTGVLLRSTGVRRDVRLNWRESYSGYSAVQFKSFVGVNGDCFDRFNLRMLEMGESLSIINQTATQLLNLYTVNVNAVSLDAYNYVTSGDLLKNKNN